MGKYRFQIGDRFRNSAGNLLEIIKLLDNTIYYKYVEKETEQSHYTINKGMLSLRLERSIYYDYTPANMKENLHKVYMKCDSIKQSHEIQNILFQLGYGWPNSPSATDKVRDRKCIKIGSSYTNDKKITIFGWATLTDVKAFKKVNPEEFLKLINNYLNNNQNVKDNKNKSEVNRPNHSSNARESGGTTVKIKGQAYRTSSSIRLSGNPIKIGRTKGKTRQLPVEGQVLSI